SARKPPRRGSLTCIPTWTGLSARPTSSFLMGAPRTSVIGTFTPHSTCRRCDPISACLMNRLFWNTDRWGCTAFSSTNRRRFARTISDAWSSTFMDQVTHTLTIHSLTSWKRKSLPMRLAALDYFAFLHGWWLNFGVPALTLSSNVLLVSLYRALFEEKEKRRVRSAFGQYLSPEVIRRLLVNPRLVEPKKTDITVMFSDIRGFTTISEKLDAQDLANFLNQYLSDMTRLVFEHHGTLDKYIGDAVMAFWGAPFEEPGHAARACQTALEMIERVREMQKKWQSEGKPHLDIGIGLNTGVASVGN